MRLWSLDPRYLDRQGLTAVWREGLLAQAVLADRTRGYRAHSQLVRFRAHPDPVGAVGAFLSGVADAATERGYTFDRARIDRPGPAGPTGPDAVPRIPVTDGQVALEWQHLQRKLAARSPDRLAALVTVSVPRVHPLFVVVPGGVEAWERLDLTRDARPSAP